MVFLDLPSARREAAVVTVMQEPSAREAAVDTTHEWRPWWCERFRRPLEKTGISRNGVRVLLDV